VGGMSSTGADNREDIYHNSDEIKKLKIDSRYLRGLVDILVRHIYYNTGSKMKASELEAAIDNLNKGYGFKYPGRIKLVERRG
jgi:hypothetical protein